MKNRYVDKQKVITFLDEIIHSVWEYSGNSTEVVSATILWNFIHGGYLQQVSFLEWKYFVSLVSKDDRITT